MQIGSASAPDDDPLSFLDDLTTTNDCTDEAGDEDCDASAGTIPIADSNMRTGDFHATPMDASVDSRQPRLGPTYTELCRAMRGRVTGYDAAIRELALVFDSRWRQASGSMAERILLIGPTGAGKSHMLRALAECLDLPCVVIDASQLSESGWQGVQPSEVVAQLFDAVGQSLELLTEGRALLCIDEVDKMIAPPRRSDAQTVSVRNGRQQGLLSILGGLTPVQFSATLRTPTPLSAVPATVSMAVRTDRIPMVCVGAFPGLRAVAGAPLTDRALTRYGMIPEFASRLTTRIVLPPRTPHQLFEMWRAEGGVVADLVRGARALGFGLTVSDTVLSMIACAISDVHSGLTPRAGAGILGAVVRRALSDALERDSRPSAIIITPDDVVSHLRPRPRASA